MENRKGQVKQTFKGDRVFFTYTQHYTAPVEKIFPFLCPVREYEYIPVWDCDLVYLETGFAEQGGVFITRFPQDGDSKDVWVISQYVPNRLIQFVRVNSIRTMVYSVKVQSNEQGGANILWEQVITGLSQEGNNFIRTLRETDFVDMMRKMENLLQHYMDTGEMMSV